MISCYVKLDYNCTLIITFSEDDNNTNDTFKLCFIAAQVDHLLQALTHANVSHDSHKHFVFLCVRVCA